MPRPNSYVFHMNCERIYNKNHYNEFTCTTKELGVPVLLHDKRHVSVLPLATTDIPKCALH